MLISYNIVGISTVVNVLQQEKFKKHFAEISLRPDQFTEYLLSAEVGFTTCERLNVQDHEAKGM